MAKSLIASVTYDQATRQLVSTVTLSGFVVMSDNMPVIAAQQVDTLRLFDNPAMTAVDQEHVVKSLAKALLTANLSLAEWDAAVRNIDKADEILASSVDPVDTFDNTLNADTGGKGPLSGVETFDAILKRPD